MGKHVIEERDVRFVGVIGGVPVRDRGRRATNAVELEFEGWKRIEVKPEQTYLRKMLGVGWVKLIVY